MCTLKFANLLRKLLVKFAFNALYLLTYLLLVLFLNLLHLSIMPFLQILLRLRVLLREFGPERVHFPLVLGVSG